jgi:hypothetical protein
METKRYDFQELLTLFQTYSSGFKSAAVFRTQLSSSQGR